MKNRLFAGLSLFVVFSLLLCGAPVNARSLGSSELMMRVPPTRDDSGVLTNEDPGFPPLQPGQVGSNPHSPEGDLPLQAELASQVVTGMPGLTFSHVQTFGVAERAYFDDTQHFSYPSGVTADGTKVWIADLDGNRAVKFDSTGVDQNSTIGSAGFREYYENQGVSLEWILDVGVDAGGGVWLVDGGAHHVAKFNSSGVYQSSLGVQWDSGTDNSHFSRPTGIAFDASGNIYISDRNNHRIQIFNNTGMYLGTLGSNGNGDFNFEYPEHIAIFGNFLYVADSNNQRVQIYNITNPLSITYVAALGSLDNAGSSNSQFDRPCGVAANANYIFVADASNNRVQVFNAGSPFGYVATIGGSYGTGNNQFKSPQDVAVDSSGKIYVSDTNNQRIQQFDNSRVYLCTYGTTGVPYLTDQQHFNIPTDVAVSADGSVYISEGRGRRILKLKTDGTPLWQVGENEIAGNDNSHLGWPMSIAVGMDGRVFVADADNNRIQVFNNNGVYLTTVGANGSADGQFKWPTGVAVDKNGNLYVADVNNCRFQVFNSSYAHALSFGSCGSGNNQFWEPRDIAVDSTGRIYVVDLGSQQVKLYDFKPGLYPFDRNGRSRKAV